MIMIVLFLSLLFEVFTQTDSARYARFSESYVTNVGSFASNGNTVYLGAKNKVLKLHFSRRVFIAQFEVLSSACPLGDDSCTDYTQHVLIADGETFGAKEDKVLVTCGTHGHRPRCVVRDLGLLKSIGEIKPLQHVATSSQNLLGLAKVHDKSFYYASYITGDTSHPIIGKYNSHTRLTSKLDPRWFNHAQFVALQPIDDHMYIFYKELTLNMNPMLTSRVARVCLNDPGGNKLLLHNHFRTFTKTTITCTSPSTLAGVPDYTYNFIDDIAIPHDTLADPNQSNRMMYGIFSNIPNGPCYNSAICAYGLKSMSATFNSNQFVRVDRGYTTVRTIKVEDTCEAPRSLYDAHNFNFLKETVSQARDDPVYTAKCRRYTAIAADRTNNIDVLFIATDDNNFMKLAINNGEGYLVDSFRIRKESKPVTNIDKQPSNNYILASGSDYLLRIPVAQCRRFNDCNACVASRDPYCGWCPIYNACVATVSCPKSVTNYDERFETANLCYPFQHLVSNNTRRVKLKKLKKKKKKRRKK